MALTSDDRLFLKRIYQNIQDRPLDPGSPFYQPIYEKPQTDDPVRLVQSHIEFNEVESIQLFSGFRGSGKTTELFRLRERLRQNGHIVLYSDALEYINPAEPVDVSDLLVALAGAFGEALKEHDVDMVSESYWTRLSNYLTKTEVDLSELGFKGELETPLKEIVGGLKTGVDLKLALRTTPTFRQRLQKFLSGRLGELKANVDKFVEDGVKAIRRKHGQTASVVFLFDSLEQIRGSLSKEQEVIRSVERLFTDHFRMLALPYIHAVYTVPPWLKFVMPNFARIVMVPNVRQWNNDQERTEYSAGWVALRAFVHKRFDQDSCRRFFGPPSAAGNYPGAERLIGVCGGHFRDLLLLLRESVLRVDSLPVTDDVIDAAISSVRGNFLPIAMEDARWLEQIGSLRSPALPSTRTDDVNRLTRFLDTRFVLYLTNGKEWYDIHPLIREEVAHIVQSAPGVAGNGASSSQ